MILVNIWIGIPFNTTILYGGLQDIPEELYEAAALDGATGWTAFRHITWPLLRPVVNVVLVLGVVYTLKVLDIILGLTRGGPANATQTIATQSYHLSFIEFDFGQGAALGNMLIVVSLVFATSLSARQPAVAGDCGDRWRIPGRDPHGARRSRARRQGGVGHTIVGVLILAVMLFPDLLDAQRLAAAQQRRGGARRGCRTDISFDGYSKALRDQGGHLRDQPGR